MVLMDYLCIGRAGELGDTKWSECYWDAVFCYLVLQWKMGKVARSKVMTLGPDYLGYEMDFFFLMFCYMMCGCGKSGAFGLTEKEQKEVIFPDLYAQCKYAIKCVLSDYHSCVC